MNLLVVLLCSTIVYCASLAHEPQCSKFHYEEQLLEKMIRMEVKVEDLEMRILQTNEKVLEAIGDIQKERQNLNNEYEELTVRYNKDMDERITTISKLEETFVTDTIAFKARGPVDKSLDTGQAIVFAETMFNYGEAYDNVTGIFRAPVGGTYLFTIHLCIQNQKYMYYGIMVDDKVQTSGVFYDHNAYQCFSADAILVLKEKLLTETIAFKARGPVDKSLETDQVIVFAETMFNYGDAYDNVTGIFRPPMEGTYLFTIHLCIPPKVNMYNGIMVDNAILTSGKFYDSVAYQCLSADAILVLKGGERVYVKCLYNSSSGDILYDSSTSTYNYWNTFSGVLIHK